MQHCTIGTHFWCIVEAQLTHFIVVESDRDMSALCLPMAVREEDKTIDDSLDDDWL